MLRKKNNYPKASNNVIVKYIEKTKLRDQGYQLTIAIVALANTDGGRVCIGQKAKSNGGIPIDLQQEYRNAVMDCFRDIRNYVKDFPIEKVDIGWDYQTSVSAYLVIYVPSFEKTLYAITWPNKIPDTVFVRENGTTVKFGTSNLSLNSIRKRVKYKILKQPVQLDGSTDYYLINISNPLDHAYKYMSMEAFVLSLLNGTWQFAEPTKWNDEYEGRFYRADYSTLKVSNCPPKLYATCITGEKASEAAWKVYAHGQGLGSKCVQIKINMGKLRSMLSKGIIQKCSNNEIAVDGTIYEGTVFYDLNDQEIDKLNTPSGAYYDTFFDKFDTQSFLKLLLIKRRAYEYEKETRLFFVPKNFESINRATRSGKGDVLNVKVNWQDIIEEIRIDKNCSEAELETIKHVCKEAKINIHDPKKRGPKKADEIPLIRFNVDKMEGKKKIPIYPKKV